MKNEAILDRTLTYVRERLAKDTSGHDIAHTLRVRNIACKITKRENADAFVVQMAALLHDIGDHGPAAVHTRSCADIAREYLEQQQIDQRTIDHICDCILTHSWSDTIGEPKTLEAKIIADSDALDAVGAVGLIRTSQWYGANHLPIHDPQIPPKPKFDGKSETLVNHIYEKLLRIDQRMFTSTGKKLARQRIAFMQEFLIQLLKEYEGER